MHKRFSEEFKKSAIIRVQNGESQLSVANSLGISYKTLPVKQCFNSRAEAQAQIQQWIFYYNGKRPHSKLGMMSPNEYFVSLLKAN